MRRGEQVPKSIWANKASDCHGASGGLAGYACYGASPATQGSFDLYWIVVDPRQQGLGLGRQLLQRVEQAVLKSGGCALWVDTSSTHKFAPTRAFYRKTGFRKSAQLKDFYRPGDSKVILVKNLGK